MLRMPLPLQLLVVSHLPCHAIVLLRCVHRSLTDVSHQPSAYSHGLAWTPQTTRELRTVLAAVEPGAESVSNEVTDLPPAFWLWPAASLRVPAHQHRAVVASLTSITLAHCGNEIQPDDYRSLIRLCPQLRSLTIEKDTAHSLVDEHIEALMQQSAPNLLCLSVGGNESLLMEAHKRHTNALPLHEFAPQLERLGGAVTVDDSALESLGCLPRLQHVELWKWERPSRIAQRLPTLTSLTLRGIYDFDVVDAALKHLCCRLPLRRLEVEQLLDSDPEEAPDVAGALQALLSPSSSCHVTLEHLELWNLPAAPLAELYQLAAALPSITSLHVDCVASTSPPLTSRDAFAAFWSSKGRQMQQLTVPRQLTRPQSPPVWSQLLTPPCELKRLLLSPSSVSWELLSGCTQNQPSTSPDECVSVDGASVRELELCERPTEDPAWRVALAIAPLSRPAFVSLHSLILENVHLTPRSVDADLPCLPHLHHLILSAEAGKVERILMWSRIAPNLHSMWIGGPPTLQDQTVQLQDDALHLSSALAAGSFPDLADLTLPAVDVSDAKVWQNLGRMRPLRRLAVMTTIAHHMAHRCGLEECVVVSGMFAQLVALRVVVHISSAGPVSSSRSAQQRAEWFATAQRIRDARPRWQVQMEILRV